MHATTNHKATDSDANTEAPSPLQEQVGRGKGADNMKLNHYTGQVPGTTPTKGQMFTTNKQTGGTTYCKGFMQNRNSHTIPNTQCNGMIVFFDSLWHDLPAGPPGPGDTKADWEKWIVDNAWTSPCGCTGEAAGGQQLFRSYNLFAWLTGFPVTNNVNTFGTRTDVNPQNTTMELQGSPPSPVFQIGDAFSPTHDGLVIFNLGLCRLNPVFALTAGIANTFPLSDPRCQLVLQYAKEPTVSACTYTPSGAPSGGVVLGYHNLL